MRPDRPGVSRRRQDGLHGACSRPHADPGSPLRLRRRRPRRDRVRRRRVPARRARRRRGARGRHGPGRAGDAEPRAGSARRESAASTTSSRRRCTSRRRIARTWSRPGTPCGPPSATTTPRARCSASPCSAIPTSSSRWRRSRYVRREPAGSPPERPADGVSGPSGVALRRPAPFVHHQRVQLGAEEAVDHVGRPTGGHPGGQRTLAPESHHEVRRRLGAGGLVAAKHLVGGRVPRSGRRGREGQGDRWTPGDDRPRRPARPEPGPGPSPPVAVLAPAPRRRSRPGAGWPSCGTRSRRSGRTCRRPRPRPPWSSRRSRAW